VRRLSRRKAIGFVGMSMASGFVTLSEEKAATSSATPQESFTQGAVFPKGAVIRTILKDTPPEQLGRGATLFHEHLSLGNAAAPAKNLVPLDIDTRVEELKAAGKDGVSCIVSAGTIDLGQNVEDVKTIALRSGIHVVLASGYYLKARYPADIATKSEDEIAGDLIRLAKVERWGALGEIGMSPNAMHEDERKVLRACCKVNLATGMPIFTHMPHEGCRPCGGEQLDVIESVGVNPRQVCIGHLADIHNDPTAETHKALAKRGVFLGFDTVGRQSLGPPDSMKLRMLLEVLDAGYEDQVLLSSDLGGMIREFKVNYGAGWGTVLLVFVPKMRFAGIKEETIQKILVDNPRRFLAFVPK
jgi:phosphotriesterase-related protein